VAKTDRPIAPRIEEIVLVDLDDGAVAELTAGARVEARRFTDIDLAGRDLSGMRLDECELSGVFAHEARFRGTVLRDVVVERLEAPVLHAPYLDLRDVSVTSSRLGSVEFHDGRWQSVRFVGCKVGFVNLRGAEIRDVHFVDCTIDELDLGNASAERVAFDGSEMRALDVTGARLRDVDLRGLDPAVIDGIAGLSGATLDALQVAMLAPHLARHLGIRVVG